MERTGEEPCPHGTFTLVGKARQNVNLKDDTLYYIMRKALIKSEAGQGKGDGVS